MNYCPGKELAVNEDQARNKCLLLRSCRISCISSFVPIFSVAPRWLILVVNLTGWRIPREWVNELWVYIEGHFWKVDQQVSDCLGETPWRAQHHLLRWGSSWREKAEAGSQPSSSPLLAVGVVLTALPRDVRLLVLQPLNEASHLQGMWRPLMLACAASVSVRPLASWLEQLLLSLVSQPAGSHSGVSQAPVMWAHLVNPSLVNIYIGLVLFLLRILTNPSLEDKYFQY